MRFFIHCFSIVLLMTIAHSAKSTTHIIQFGGSFFHSYNPNTLTVAVGDTVTWKENGGSSFLQHSLRSDTIPIGAESFGVIDTGTSFSYVVKTPGYYHYICTEHLRLEHMMGSFIAEPTSSVETEKSMVFCLDQNFPNPFQRSTTIHYTLEEDSHVQLTIFDLNGKQITKLLDNFQNAGSYKIVLDAFLPKGTYFYRLQTDGRSLEKKMILN